MAIVGINFGSATGGSGFDVTSTVASIVGNMKAIETPWTNQLTTLKSQDTAFTSIGTDLGTLSTSLRALTDFQGVMASKLGSSSNSNIVSLGSAGPTAVAGSHTVVVSQLAQTSSAYSEVIPTADTLSGALTIQVGTGAATTIPVVSGTSDTLSTYAAAINLAGIGVTASVITDTTGSRLSLLSNTGGVGGQLTVTAPDGTFGALTDGRSGKTLGMNAGPQGQNAKLSVDGVSISSPSNTISTAIRGVTFQVLTADPSTPVQVQIVNDNSAVASAFSALVTAYNAVVVDIKTQEGNDSSGNPQPLFGNSVISQLQSSLSLALTSGSRSGAINSLYELAMSVSQDGTLTLDSTALESALNSSYPDVVAFMQDGGSFGQQLSTTLDQIGNQSPMGAITLALATNSRQEATLNQDVTTRMH